MPWHVGMYRMSVQISDGYERTTTIRSRLPSAADAPAPAEVTFGVYRR